MVHWGKACRMPGVKQMLYKIFAVNLIMTWIAQKFKSSSWHAPWLHYQDLWSAEHTCMAVRHCFSVQVLHLFWSFHMQPGRISETSWLLIPKLSQSLALSLTWGPSLYPSTDELYSLTLCLLNLLPFATWKIRQQTLFPCAELHPVLSPLQLHISFEIGYSTLNSWPTNF